MMWFLFFLALFAVYALISYSIFHSYTYIHSNLLFYAEKALIAIQSNFKFENIGFVYPPASFVPFLLYNNPLIIPAFVSALVSTLFALYIMKEFKTNLISSLIIVLLFLNPLYIFLATQRFDVIIFYILLAVSVGYSIKYLAEKHSVYVFYAGILFGLTFFVDFRSVFLIPLYALTFFLSTKKDNIPYRIAVMIVKLTPIFFFVLSWLYLNWLFMGDPFYFIKSPYSFFKGEPVPEEFKYAAGSFMQSLMATLRELMFNLPLILPYFVVLFFVGKNMPIYGIPVYLTYLIPVFLMYFSIYYHVFFPYRYTSILFLLFALIFALYTKTSKHIAVLISMIISFISSFILPIYSKDLNEKLFIEAIMGKPIQKLTKEEALLSAKIIRYSNCTNILSDDAYTFPVIYFTGRTDKFILPHNYVFYSALSNPSLFVDCLLISSNRKDLINKRFPEAQNGRVPGFYLLYRGSEYMIFKRLERNN